MAVKGVTHPVTGELGYRIRLYVGKRVDGGSIITTKTIYGITVYQAQKIEEEMKIAAARAKGAGCVTQVYKLYLKSGKNKTLLLKNAFEASLQKPEGAISENHLEENRQYWGDFVFFMKKKNPLIKFLSDVTPVMAEDYIAYIRKNGRFRQRKSVKKLLSNSTLNAMLKSLRRVFRVLRREVEMENPFAEIKLLPTKQQDREAFTKDQLATIFEKADKEYMYPLFFIGLFTGLAEGDVCTLRKDEISWDRRHIYHRRNKTGAMSNIPMLPALQEYLLGLCNDPENTSEWVLPKQHDLYCNKGRWQVSRDIKRFLEMTCDFETKVKVKNRTRLQSVLDFHSLRHTFCTMTGVAGIPLTVVQSIVGHMTPAMTSLYSQHVDEEARLYWINMLKSNSVLPAIGFSEVQTDIPDNGELAVLLQTKNITPEQKKQILAIINQ